MELNDRCEVNVEAWSEVVGGRSDRPKVAVRSHGPARTHNLENQAKPSVELLKAGTSFKHHRPAHCNHDAGLLTKGKTLTLCESITKISLLLPLSCDLDLQELGPHEEEGLDEMHMIRAA